MKHIHVKFEAVNKIKGATLLLSQVMTGELPCYPRSTNQTKANGDKKTLAMFVTLQCKPKPIMTVASLAITKYAPSTQMMPPSPSSESNNDILLIQLLNKKPKASKAAACHPLHDKQQEILDQIGVKQPTVSPPAILAPPIMQEAMVLDLNDEYDDNDKVKVTSVADPMGNQPLIYNYACLHWMENKPFELLNSRHNSYN